jgi:hypothetical protein
MKLFYSGEVRSSKKEKLKRKLKRKNRRKIIGNQLTYKEERLSQDILVLLSVRKVGMFPS